MYSFRTLLIYSISLISVWSAQAGDTHNVITLSLPLHTLIEQPEPIAEATPYKHIVMGIVSRKLPLIPRIALFAAFQLVLRAYSLFRLRSNIKTVATIINFTQKNELVALYYNSIIEKQKFELLKAICIDACVFCMSSGIDIKGDH